MPALRAASLWIFLLVFSLPIRTAPLSAATNRVPGAAGHFQAASSAALSEKSGSDGYVLPRDRAEKARVYSDALYTVYFVRVLSGMLLSVLILRLGIAARFRDIAESSSGARCVQALVFTPLLLLVLDLCQLPTSAYAHALSLRYEQSIQGWGSWFWDYAKAALLTLALAIVVVLVLDVLLRRSPRRWWLYLWTALLPMVMALVFGAPLIIDPLFHRFEPLAMSQPDLVARFEKIAQHAGVTIPPDRTFLMKASEKTNEVNAYVTGLGSSKRVVIWDTTIQKLPPEQTLFIVGHELGHYALGHVWKGSLFFAGLLLFGLYTTFRALHWALDRWGAAWKIYSQHDWAALAAMFLVLQVLSFLLTPVVNGFSRSEEHAADVYGLEVIHGIIPDSQGVAARSFQALGELDLADPNPPPFVKLWLYSHPPLADRLVFAHEYDPWSKGEAPKYVQ